MTRTSLSNPNNQRAFTLIEMSIVLVIIGLIIMTVFPALQAMRSATQQAQTQSHLESLLRASAAYTQAHGCLPCPTPADAVTAGLGRVRGATNPNANTCTPTTETCTAEGIPPFVSLGLPMSMAKDGWGRWITMRVDPTLTSATLAIIPPTAPCTTDDVANAVCTAAQLNLRQKGLCTPNLKASGTPITIRALDATTQEAAILFASHGRNGYGAYLTGRNAPNHPAFPTTGLPFAPTCSNRLEVCNADASDALFFQGLASPDPLVEFDDLLIYTDRNALLSLLGLGACESTW